jgi:hypothetical protein
MDKVARLLASTASSLGLSCSISNAKDASSSSLASYVNGIYRLLLLEL